MMRGTGPPPQNLYQHNFSYRTNSGYSKSVERRVLMQRLKEEREGQGQPFPVGFGETYPGHPTGGPPEFAALGSGYSYYTRIPWKTGFAPRGGVVVNTTN